MRTRPDARRRVALGVVLVRSGHVTPQQRQIGRQLQDPVHGSDKDLPGFRVDRQVSEGCVQTYVDRFKTGPRPGLDHGDGRDRGQTQEEQQEESGEKPGHDGARGGPEDQEDQVDQRRPDGAEED